MPFVFSVCIAAQLYGRVGKASEETFHNLHLSFQKLNCERNHCVCDSLIVVLTTPLYSLLTLTSHPFGRGSFGSEPLTCMFYILAETFSKHRVETCFTDGGTHSQEQRTLISKRLIRVRGVSSKNAKKAGDCCEGNINHQESTFQLDRNCSRLLGSAALILVCVCVI